MRNDNFTSPTLGGYIARIIGIAFMLVGLSLLAFGGGELYEVISSAFVAGRQVVDETLWSLLR